MLNGVTGTVVGYTGGDNPHPTYQSVCAGDGHLEAIQVEYDDSEISYEDLLNAFLNLHIPNTLGKRQYRSAILFHNHEQKEVAEQVLQQQDFPLDLLQPASTWHDAEEYHQKYAQKQMDWLGGD